MIELITLTREQYQEDIYSASMNGAKYMYEWLVKKDRPAVVNRAEAARLLNKSKSTIKSMIDTQRIRTTADGTGIPYTEIERYLNA